MLRPVVLVLPFNHFVLSILPLKHCIHPPQHVLYPDLVSLDILCPRRHIIGPLYLVKLLLNQPSFHVLILAAWEGVVELLSLALGCISAKRMVKILLQ